jgi:hypothetical protein
MTHEGHEWRSKHREEIGGSSWSRTPSAQPNNLAKRPRPSTLHEESSPEDSPPRGGPPESPKEFECRKIRSPKAHTNQEVVNYNKVDLRNIVALCEKACYSLGKERALMRGSRLSFSRIGTTQGFTGRPHQLSRRRTCSSAGLVLLSACNTLIVKWRVVNQDHVEGFLMKQ